MKKLLLITILSTGSVHAQLFSFQSGSGVPTDTAMGGLLGMLIAPMVSKGQDAKLVGGLLGAAAMNAMATANAHHQQQYQTQQVPQNVERPALGIKQGKMIKSPYSPFQFDPSSMRLKSGEVLFDPFTGQPIVIP